ncbi:hypothetical protein TWF481_007848 [Arthrobotrys musiformis]|uniref:Polymerase nucleotidyl transferase domain-containing protein n=1 Tax=Arthrobotrys musiformis TaxID=47236 RepID=A0AAV9W5E5_9PEZI
MGSRVPASDIDLLIKDSQFDSIQADIKASELFEKVDQHSGARLSDEYVQNSVPRFFSKTAKCSDTSFVNLWSEDVYKLKIDDAELMQVEGLTVLNPHVLDERFTRIPETIELSPEKLRSHGCSTISKRAFRGAKFFIPSIPALCSALLSQAEYHRQNSKSKVSRPLHQLENLIRYLYLDNPAHRDLILPLLGCHSDSMGELIRRYKRKPHVVFERGPDGEVKVIEKRIVYNN